MTNVCDKCVCYGCDHAGTCTYGCSMCEEEAQCLALDFCEVTYE